MILEVDMDNSKDLKNGNLLFNPTEYEDEYDGECEAVCSQLNDFYKLLIERLIKEEKEGSPQLVDTKSKISILKTLKTRSDLLTRILLNNIWAPVPNNGFWIDEDKFLLVYQELL